MRLAWRAPAPAPPSARSLTSLSRRLLEEHPRADAHALHGGHDGGRSGQLIPDPEHVADRCELLDEGHLFWLGAAHTQRGAATFFPTRSLLVRAAAGGGGGARRAVRDEAGVAPGGKRTVYPFSPVLLMARRDCTQRTPNPQPGARLLQYARRATHERSTSGIHNRARANPKPPTPNPRPATRRTFVAACDARTEYTGIRNCASANPQH